MQTGRLSGLLQNHTKLHTDQCVDAKGKVTSHLPTYFPIYSCIEKIHNRDEQFRLGSWSFALCGDAY